ncbi:MAG: glutathione S-transferase family protein [Nitratireductor sp.]|nr:glutathione S-transferase family protein [Nitratireductor sp.]
MITVYGTGPMFGLPHASPFAFKAEMLLKISGLPYKLARADIRKAPKGKIPWIDDDGVIVPDTAFIKRHLEEKHGIDFSGGYSKREQGIGLAVERLLEDHVYWLNIHSRWLDGDNFQRGPFRFFDDAPALIRPLIRKMVLRTVQQSVHAHGIGRHDAAGREYLGKLAIDAMADILGDNPYILGERVCGTDATAFAFMASLACPVFASPHIAQVHEHANLVAYLDRMTRSYFPDLATASS